MSYKTKRQEGDQHRLTTLTSSIQRPKYINSYNYMHDVKPWPREIWSIYISLTVMNGL